MGQPEAPTGGAARAADDLVVEAIAQTRRDLHELLDGVAQDPGGMWRDGGEASAMRYVDDLLRLLAERVRRAALGLPEPPPPAPVALDEPAPWEV